MPLNLPPSFTPTPPPGVFVHPLGLCESQAIGAGTRIWAFAHVMSKATLGKDCNVGETVFIENDVVIGDRVTIKNGVQVWDAVRLEDDVFVGPNATFTNDKFPRSKVPVEKYPVTRVCKGASIGANATILPGVTIGPRAMVGAGAVVTRDVPPHAVVVGNPAKVVGFTAGIPAPASVADGNAKAGQDATAAAMGVWQRRYGRVESVAVGDFPFVPQRCEVVESHSPLPVAYARRAAQQLVVAVRGRGVLWLDNRVTRIEVALNEAGQGVFVPPMVWTARGKLSADVAWLVFSSAPNLDSDWITDYAAFVA